MSMFTLFTRYNGQGKLANQQENFVSTLMKTPAQIEFAEIFARMERNHKITQSTVARALRIERSYVSMLVNGLRSPHLRVLQDMRELEKLFLGGRDPEALEEEIELKQVMEQLKFLKHSDRPSYESVRQLIGVLGQPPAEPPVPVIRHWDPPPAQPDNNASK